MIREEKKRKKKKITPSLRGKKKEGGEGNTDREN